MNISNTVNDSSGTELRDDHYSEQPVNTFNWLETLSVDYHS